MSFFENVAKDIARSYGSARATKWTHQRETQRADTLETAGGYRRPREWPDYIAAEAMKLVRRCVARDFTGPAAVRETGPEERDEIAAAIMCRIVSGPDIPEDTSLAQWVRRACRYARLTKGYDNGLKRDEPREHIEIGEALAGPYRGASVDARQADPCRAAIAAEEATRDGITAARPKHVANRRKSVRTRRHYQYQIVRGSTVYRWDRVKILGAQWYRRPVPVATQITVERIPTSSKRHKGDRHNNPRSRYASPYRPAPLLYNPPTGRTLYALTEDIARQIDTLRAAVWQLRRRHAKHVERVRLAREKWGAYPVGRAETHTDIAWLTWRETVAAAAAQPQRTAKYAGPAPTPAQQSAPIGAYCPLIIGRRDLATY